MTNKLKKLSSAAIAIFTLGLMGCQVPMPLPQPSIENIQKGRQINKASAALGVFTAGEIVDNKIGLRAYSLVSPINQSFAQYLRTTLHKELAAAGLLKPKSANILTGKLLDNQLSSAIHIGKATLAARFTVTHHGQTRYDKELRVKATWDSSFMGTIAIPEATRQYVALYRKLAGQLLDDPAFRQAIKDE
jgi:hypothetical protein